MTWMQDNLTICTLERHDDECPFTLQLNVADGASYQRMISEQFTELDV